MNNENIAPPLTAKAEQEIRRMLDRPHYTFLPSEVRSLLASLDEARKLTAEVHRIAAGALEGFAEDAPEVISFLAAMTKGGSQ